MKQDKTGGRLIRILYSKGYVLLDHSHKPPMPILKLSQLVRDRVSANEFFTWRCQDRWGNWFSPVDTDLIDLNEKMILHGFPPLPFEINSKSAEIKGKDLLDNFGNKAEIK